MNIFTRTALSLSLMFATTTAQAREFSAPFDSDWQRVMEGKDVSITKPYICTPVPEPQIYFEANSMYGASKGDASRSVIDPKAKAAYDQKVARVDQLIRTISKTANHYVRYRPVRSNIAQCALDQLYRWAEVNALTQVKDKTSLLILDQRIASLALSYLQIRQDLTLNMQKKKMIEDWLCRLAAIQQTHFDAHPELGSSRNNHRYWAGLSVGAVGVATGKEALFQWGVESIRAGLDQLTEEGYLPLEVERGKRAFLYHNHAVMPMVMMAEIAMQHGVDLYADGKLHLLVRNVVRNWKDTAPLEKRSGKKQDQLMKNGQPRSDKLAWLQIYHTRFPVAEHAALLKSLPNFRNSSLGGDLRLLFRSNRKARQY